MGYPSKTKSSLVTHQLSVRTLIMDIWAAKLPLRIQIFSWPIALDRCLLVSRLPKVMAIQTGLVLYVGNRNIQAYFLRMFRFA